MSRSETRSPKTDERELVSRLNGRPIVLIGMMGAGKTTVGRRIAQRLGLNFIDSDAEIEKAANLTIPEIFEKHGEADFRAGEAKVIARLLKEPNVVLGTGGGAFVHPETRALIKATAISVWLKADTDLLLERVSRRANRPLLQTADPRATLDALIAARYPIYAEADVTVNSRDVPHDDIAGDVIQRLAAHLQTERTVKANG